MKRVELQPAFILHQRKYRDTSLLLDILTLNYGNVSLVARGSRGSKKSAAAKLQPFKQLLISWAGKGELYTMTGVEEAERPTSERRLQGRSLYCAYYLNELTLKLMPGEDPHPDVFAAYSVAVSALSKEPESIETVLRQYELTLLGALGYQLVLDCEAESGQPIDKDTSYRYFPDQGAVLDSGQKEGIPISGQTLIDLSALDVVSTQARAESRRLLKQLIDHHLDGKKLQSREIYRAMFSAT